MSIPMLLFVILGDLFLIGLVIVMWFGIFERIRARASWPRVEGTVVPSLYGGMGLPGPRFMFSFPFQGKTITTVAAFQMQYFFKHFFRGVPAGLNVTVCVNTKNPHRSVVYSGPFMMYGFFITPTIFFTVITVLGLFFQIKTLFF